MTCPTAPPEGWASLSRKAHVRAAELYDQGWFCSEAVVTTVNELAGEPYDPSIMRLATGFCGVWRKGHVCGAFAGAVMGLGLLVGRDTPNEDWAVPLDAEEELETRFVDEFGALECPAVIGSFGRMAAPGRHEHCVDVTGRAAELVFAIAGERFVPRPPAGA